MNPKVRITQSLLSSWVYIYKKETGYEEFLAALNRKKSAPTFEMLEGNRFESCLNSVLNGEFIPEDHEWYKPITEMAEELKGSQQQVTIFKDTFVDGERVLLHGVLDYLVAGHIYDCKYSVSYGGRKGKNCKYYFSPQTSMYMSLVPEAKDMTYIICDGEFVYRERYPRDIVPPIEPTVKQFYDFLKTQNLWDVYVENWKVKGW